MSEADSTTEVAPTAGVTVRSYMSHYFYCTAKHNAIRCRNLESELSVGTWDIRQREAALTAVISAVAFTEAYVNETFDDAADDNFASRSERTAAIPQGLRRHLKAVWASSYSDTAKILAKYQDVLALAGRELFDTGAEPAYQDAFELVRLRNALVHYKPTWESREVSSKLQNALRGKFEPNTLLPHNAWWPDGALGAGCAEWACKTAETLVDAWAARLGSVPGYKATWEAYKGSGPDGE